MSNEDQIYQKIDDYLNQKLQGEDRMIFEKELKENASLREKVNAFRIADELIIENRLQDVKSILHSEHHGNNGSDGWKNRLWIFTGLLILPALVIFSYEFIQRDKVENELPQLNKVQSSASMEEQKPHIIFDKHTDEKKTSNEFYQSEKEKEKEELSKEKVEAGKEVVPEIKEKSVEDKGVFKSQEPILNTEVAADPCSKNPIKLKLLPTASCKGESNGTLHLTITGGIGPFESKLTDVNNKIYDNLQEIPSGNYILEVRDHEGCLAKEKINISEKICFIDFHFNPFIGQTWTIPSDGKKAKLKVFEKSGNLYWETELSDNVPNEWEGRSLNGELNPGYYIFTIEFLDGSIKSGSVTIVQ